VEIGRKKREKINVVERGKLKGKFFFRARHIGFKSFGEGGVVKVMKV
jgi:hypothetical protein